MQLVYYHVFSRRGRMQLLRSEIAPLPPCAALQTCVRATPWPRCCCTGRWCARCPSRCRHARRHAPGCAEQSSTPPPARSLMQRAWHELPLICRAVPRAAHRRRPAAGPPGGARVPGPGHPRAARGALPLPQDAGGGCAVPEPGSPPRSSRVAASPMPYAACIGT